ncbi:MAG: hypothetical protein ACLRRT_14000 [Ruthenibacterium lactatiformans]
MDENEKRLLRQIDAFVKRSHEDILQDVKTLVDIKSVQGEPAPGAPFGMGPKRALEAALEIASGMGLFTRNCEGYAGYADLPGKSENRSRSSHIWTWYPRAADGQATRSA